MLAPQIPLQRGGSADEVAQTILFLLSDEASYVTGAIYKVTGGRCSRKRPVSFGLPFDFLAKHLSRSHSSSRIRKVVLRLSPDRRSAC